MKRLCVVALAVALSGCATLEQRAHTAAVADGVTTAAGIALGAAELNPLGAPVAILVKLPILMYAQTLPDHERAAFHALAAPIWSGATASNVCVIASILSGGTFGPVCIGLGIAFGWQQWTASEPERTFYARCAEYRAHVGGSFACVYRMPEEMVAAQ